MAKFLRADLQVIDMGPAGSVLLDPISGARFRFGDPERHLMQGLDEGQAPERIRRGYRERFGRELPRRRLREFVQQLHQLGLVEAGAGAAAERTPASSPSQRRAVPAPLTDADPASGLNHRFDLGVLLLGWLLHPVCLLPLLGLCLVAAGGLIRAAPRYLRELFALYQQNPPGVVVALLLVRLVFLTLPRELLVGLACRRFGGRVRGFGLQFFRGLVPTFRCEVGDSAALARARGRWTLLTIRFCGHLAIGSVATIGWLMAEPGSVMGTFWLLLMLPCAFGALVLLNIFAPLDGYVLLVHALAVPDLRRRALAQTAAWLTLRCPPEPLTDRERFWFRVYGLGVYGWRVLAYAVVVGLFGWLLISRFDGIGALIGAAVLIRWHQDSIRRTMVKNNAFRWIVRGGGRWWLRWPVRLIVLGAIVACGFIPYHHEVSGECLLVPAAEQGVRAEIAGTVEDLRVSEGDWVRQGAVIATLAAREEYAAVETTKAQLARAKAQLALLRAGARTEEIAMAAEQVKLRQIELDHYGSELRRLLDMHAAGAANETEIRRAQEERDSAEQMLRIAREYLQRVEKGAREEEIQAAEAEVQRVEAELAHRKKMLALREITAPISGRVVTPNIDQRLGQNVQPGDLIAVLHDTSRLRVQATFPDAAALQIQPGLLAKVRLWGLDGRLVTGHVDRVLSRVVDYTELSIERIRSDRESQLEEALQPQQDRGIRVYVELDEQPQGLLPGMTGYTRVVVSRDRLWRALLRPVVRFARVEIWSWLP